jgi:acetylornithine deacetylase
LFCTHLDTVPPYIGPSIDDAGSIIKGRGTSDAKGQIFAMYEACLELERRGHDGFGLLLLAGEETGSYGAKAFREVHPGAEWVIVGEPTDNCMASAAKGTKSFEITFTGQACHSGYPENGQSAIMHFNDFMNALRSIVFPSDPVLGKTTWNIGKLSSDNPQNILSEHLTCRVYFRTTFESDEMVCNVMKNMAGPEAKLRFGRPKVQDGSDIVAKEVASWQRAMSVRALGGDDPSRFEVLEGFETKPVAFGSDAPQLKCFEHKILCGPGSILVAHTDEEHVSLSDLETAVQNYIKIYDVCTSSGGESVMNCELIG